MYQRSSDQDQKPNPSEVGPGCKSTTSQFLPLLLRYRKFRSELMRPIITKIRKTNDGRWSRSGSTRDLPTIAFFRAGTLLRRNEPVPGILAAHRPGAIMEKSGRRFVVRLGQGSQGPAKMPPVKARTKKRSRPKPNVIGSKTCRDVGLADSGLPRSTRSLPEVLVTSPS
jgi:hypothetical protein